MQSDRKRVVVVGGGLAGLASAVELSTRGLDVTIVDRNRHLGGKMNVLQEQGFTFDMGPTILTMPQVIRGIISRTGRNVSDYIDIVDLDPQWRCFYDDGTVIDLRGDVDTMATAMDRQFPGQGVGAGWRSFIDYSRRMYGLSEKVFFYRDLGGVVDMMKTTPTTEPGVLKDVLGMRMHSTVGRTIHKHIREPHLAQLCEHFLQYVGSSPFLAPAILTLIAAAQVDHGCCYAMGGTRMVAGSLERILREEEATIVTGVGVRRILQERGRTTGVELEDGRTIAADVVVSNCDVQRTYRDLLGDEESLNEQARIGRRYRPACSGVVLYLGLDRQYDHLLHHDFLFSNDPSYEFADIYDRGIPARDPSVYLCVPSRTDPAQAPEGGEALYALIHTPYLRPGQEWHGPGGLLEQYRPIVMDKLKRHGMEDIEDHIVVERHLTPQDIDRMYNAEGGAIYGLASHGRLAGGFKPRNRSRTLDGLYLAGGSTNPGPGVPMVLMSGVTAALAVAEDLGIGDPRNHAIGEEECREQAMAV
ncbi:MAG: phytoene desaturase family protein [Planctomycetota bacterium]|nr:phytoene desaturase family protein [Planctomycetota bacterium]MEE2895172.1 phytoene desaturase family protein [Planctomycetota bacterium]